MASLSQSRRSRLPAIVLWGFLLILCAVCVAGADIGSGGLRSAWTLATTHQPERYTQLFFENPGQLPSYAPAGKPQTIYFHIVNHEAQAQVYQYKVQKKVNGVSKVQLGRVYLRDGADARIAVHFTIARPSSAADIQILLVGRTEQLLFRSKS